MRTASETFIHSGHWRCALTLVGVLACAAPASAQSGTSAGREFLLAFLPNIPDTVDPAGNEQLVELHLTAEAPVDVTVEWPAISPTFSRTVSLVPGILERVALPRAAAQSWVSDQVQDMAVRLTGAEPFTVYMVDLVFESSDAALGIPIEGMGTDYILAGHGDSVGFQGNFSVVASEDNTTVTITPSTYLDPHPANVPYSVLLQAGESYLGPPTNGRDATGTVVASDKPVGVTNGVQCAWVPAGRPACDHIFEVAQPTSTWGSRFVLANLPGRPEGSVYRVLAASDNTRVELDGLFLADLQRGEFRELGPIAGDHFIESSEPSFVLQYVTARSSPGADIGDPSLGNVIPIDQYLPAYTFSTVGGDRYVEHHLVLTLRDEDVATATLDGLPVPVGLFSPVAGSGFSAARFPVEQGVHRTESDNPHAVMVLGYKEFDSYLYPAGAGLLNLGCVDRDIVPPRLLGIEPDAVVACDEVPLPAEPTATDDCDSSPTVDFTQTRTDGACPDSYSLLRRWTATDDAGLSTTVERLLEVIDGRPPSLLGVPRDVRLACDSDVDAPVVSVIDDCDPEPVLEFRERREEGPCPDAYTLTRTWTAFDRCGNQTSASQVVEVSDDRAPTLLGVPADVRVSCDAIPPAGSPRAIDDCDPAPAVEYSETRVDGPCPDRYTLRREWAATDRCGNLASAVQVVEVVDDGPPTLLGVPSDRVVECDAVPPPAVVSVTDACDPHPSLGFTEIREDGACPGEYVLTRTWSAEDRCGNRSTARAVITVIDTTPPVVFESEEDLHCLWPPSHGFACFTQADFAPLITDDCSEPVSWRFVGCDSDQPEDGTGDGNTEADCVVGPDGRSFCVRAERQGGRRTGRRYAVRIVAEDACGNESASARIGTIWVPHDGSGRPESCRSGETRGNGSRLER